MGWRKSEDSETTSVAPALTVRIDRVRRPGAGRVHISSTANRWSYSRSIPVPNAEEKSNIHTRASISLHLRHKSLTVGRRDSIRCLNFCALRQRLKDDCEEMCSSLEAKHQQICQGFFRLPHPQRSSSRINSADGSKKCVCV